MRNKLNDVKQTIGFFSITIAWTLMNIINSVYIAFEDGKATDSGVIIFWSGLFIFIGWIFFLIWPISLIDHSKRILQPMRFTALSVLYAAIVYFLIVGGLFRSIELLWMFLPQAILTGLLFGLTHSMLMKSKKLIHFLYGRPLSKSLLFVSPIFILVFFLWILPMVAPALVFRFVPDEVRDSIIVRTIPKFEVGDDIQLLQNALPGYLDHIQGGVGNMFAIMEDFTFVLQVNCGKIIRLEYGQNQFDIDGTIYGKLQNSPCP